MGFNRQKQGGNWLPGTSGRFHREKLGGNMHDGTSEKKSAARNKVEMDLK